MDILELVQQAGIEPRKKASCHGGEYCSPCPFCREGRDRFLVWPKRLNKNGDYKGGRFSCRGCNKHGDAITFIRELFGLSYVDACTRLRIEPKKCFPLFTSKPSETPAVATDPPLSWMNKAQSFIEWCHEQLMNNSSAQILLMKRGFTQESIIRFKLGFNPNNFYRERPDWGLPEALKEDGSPRKLWLPDGFTIPTFSSSEHVVKIKIRRSTWFEGDRLPKYIEVSGSQQSSSIYGDVTLPTALILESELDALLIQQFASDLVYCIALGGSTKPIDFHTDKLLRSTSVVLFCPDFDEAGAKAWAHWKKLFPTIKRILTPNGKAPGDAHLEGTNLKEWIIENLKTCVRI